MNIRRGGGLVITLFLGLLNFSFAASLSDMEDYLDQYCSSTRPVSGCGMYQWEVDQAKSRANQLDRLLNEYDSYEKSILLDDILWRLAKKFDSSWQTTERFRIAYYYVFFSTMGQGGDDVDDFLGILFDDKPTYSWGGYRVDTPSYGRDSYSKNPPYYGVDDGEIVGVWSDDRGTRVVSNRDRIEVLNRRLMLGISAEDDRGYTATDENFHVLAVFFRDARRSSIRGDNVISAYYDRGDKNRHLDRTVNSDWEEMTIYLLCEDCRYGSDFLYYSTYDDWAVVDSWNFDIDVDGDYSDRDRDCDDYYDNCDYDLSITDLDYSYDTYGDETIVELTTTIKNVGDYEVELEELRYEIEVDYDRLSSRDYEIEHVETDCDDSYVSRYDDEHIDIEEGDRCEITVEIIFDEDDVSNERVEILVELVSDEDDNSSNDDEKVTFTVRSYSSYRPGPTIGDPYARADNYLF